MPKVVLSSYGDPMYGQPDVVTAEDVLGFAGIAPPTLHLYPIETHIAEKLHAYTMPRPRPNTRVKDLPDIALLARARPLDAQRLQQAILQTFAFRKTHECPTTLPPSPSTWTIPYATLAHEDHLPWSTLDEVTQAASILSRPHPRAPPRGNVESESVAVGDLTCSPSEPPVNCSRS
ncbi:MAG: nucleotidyl transferase AbiEii/AbiGii toxin family protein [Polyangiaceae bacterium]